MSCDVGEVTERLENKQSFDCDLTQSPFFKLSVTSPMSQLIFQPFRRFTYVTSTSLASPGEQSMSIYITGYNKYKVNRDESLSENYTGSKARVRSRELEGWKFFFTPCQDWS